MYIRRQASNLIPMAETMTEAILSIRGMNCGHCVKAVQSALSGVPGVRSHEVNVGSARVSYEEDKTSLEAIAKAVEDEGYKGVRS